VLQGDYWRTRPKSIEGLHSLIVNGVTGKAPPEYIEHLYRKEYGLTTYEFLAEPIDRIRIFAKIKEFEGRREQIEQNKLERQSRRK